MTGFARATGGDEALSWAWEVKSVNGKGLDMRSRLPAGSKALEAVARKALQASFARGNFQVTQGKNPNDLFGFINNGDMMQILFLHYLGRLPVFRVVTNRDWRTGHVAFYSHRSFLVY